MGNVSKSIQNHPQHQALKCSDWISLDKLPMIHRDERWYLAGVITHKYPRDIGLIKRDFP